MAEQDNLFGAIIFWLYIAFALLFTFFAIESIVSLPRPTPSKHAATFIGLAVLSFSTLSFNMLHVLFDSYSTWSERQISPTALSPSSIWKWSITSTLFRNFGEAIVANEARLLWTQSALLATLSVNLFMGMQGLQHRIPRLWAFFALSQILPISFAQNLFYIALLRSPNARGRSVEVSRPSIMAVIAAYSTCLFIAPSTAGGPYLMPTILAARLILLLPAFLPKFVDQKEKRSVWGPLSHSQAQANVALLAAAMTGRQIVLLAGPPYSLWEIWSALFSHPAVTSLGFDFLVTATSFTVWIYMQRTSKVAQAKKTT